MAHRIPTAGLVPRLAWLILTSSASAQSKSPAPARAYSTPRASWGDPDLQGIWPSGGRITCFLCVGAFLCVAAAGGVLSPPWMGAAVRTAAPTRIVFVARVGQRLRSRRSAWRCHSGRRSPARHDYLRRRRRRYATPARRRPLRAPSATVRDLDRSRPLHLSDRPRARRFLDRDVQRSWRPAARLLCDDQRRQSAAPERRRRLPDFVGARGRQPEGAREHALPAKPTGSREVAVGIRPDGAKASPPSSSSSARTSSRRSCARPARGARRLSRGSYRFPSSARAALRMNPRP